MKMNGDAGLWKMQDLQDAERRKSRMLKMDYGTRDGDGVKDEQNGIFANHGMDAGRAGRRRCGNYECGRRKNIMNAGRMQEPSGFTYLKDLRIW